MTGQVQAGRVILSALLCALIPGAGAAPDRRAAVEPDLSGEFDKGRALLPGGAQKAKAMALHVRANRVLEEKGAAAALPVFREIMALDPGNSSLAGRVASMAAAAGEPGEARRLLEEAVAKNPGAEGPVVALTRFLISRMDDGVQAQAEAVTMLRGAMAKFPGSRELCALAVRMAVSDQRRDDAQAAVRQTLAKGSADPAFWLAMAPVAREAFPLDDPDTKVAHMEIVGGCVEKAVALAPDNPAVLEEAGDFYGRLQMQEKAAGFYRKAAAAVPGNLAVRRKLGQCQRLLNDTVGAQRTFEELLQVDDSDAVAHRAMASLLDAAGKPKEALRHRVALLRHDGGSAAEFLKLAARLEEAGMADERRLTLERGCFSWPDSPRLAIAYAGALHRYGRIAEATEQYEKAVVLASKHEPDALDDAFYRDRALCARDAGERETAAVYFRKAIDKTPRSKPERAVTSYAGLAMLWLEDGVKLEEARELLRLAAALAKDDPGVAEAMGLYAAKKGDWETALLEYEKSEKAAPSARLLIRQTDALEQGGRKEEAIAKLEKAAAVPGASASLRTRLDALRGAAQAVKSQPAPR